MANSGNISSDCIDTLRGDDRMEQLRELCRVRSVLYFEIGDDSPKTYISRLQSIHDNSTLLIDPLMPPEGDELIGDVSSVKACCTYNGVRYEFEASLVGVIKGESPALMMTLPSVITRIQVRQYGRVSFSKESAIPVTVVRSSRTPEPMNGTAVQLGAGGMGVIVPSPTGWETGTNIERLMFALPAGHVINTAATVRSLFPVYRTDGSISSYRCNLQFVRLEQRHSATIEAFVFRKQLEAGSAGTEEAR